MLVDLTQIMVKQGIALVLPVYAQVLHHPPAQRPQVRNELTHYVLQRLESYLIEIDSDQLVSLRPQIFRLTFQQRDRILTLIHEGLQQLLPPPVAQSMTHQLVRFPDRATPDWHR